MLYSICQKLFYKVRQEAVLSIAVLLALLSACFVLPDASYFGYIDFRTLTILFSLMTVMAGLQRQGVFTRFAYSLLSQYSKGERNEGQERNVVRDQHTAKKA